MGLEILGEYLAHVHVKNARWFLQEHRQDKSVIWKCDAAPVHKGVADVRDFLKALKAVGYDDWISLEDFSTERTLENRLRENLTSLKRVETEIDAVERDATSLQASE